MDKRLFISYLEQRCDEFREQYDPEKSWDCLMGKIRRRRLYRICRYSAVAAVIGALIIIGVTRKTEKTEIKKQDFVMSVSFPERGCGKAILTLADGRQLDLTSMYGTIANLHGILANNITGNRLVYTDTLQTSGIRPVYNTLTVPRGGEYHLQLSDGTQVAMNAESTLYYPISFTAECREVYLTGEAYFEVAKDLRHPFIVHAGNNSIEVLGTRFDVSAYKDSDVRITLLSGCVKVRSPQASAILHPDMQAVIDAGNHEITTRQVDASRYASWTKGIYEFRNTPLDEIMEQLGRWYDVDISFQSQELRHKHFTGILYRNEELGFAFEILERVSNITFRRNGKKIYVENVH